MQRLSASQQNGCNIMFSVVLLSLYYSQETWGQQSATSPLIFNIANGNFWTWIPSEIEIERQSSLQVNYWFLNVGRKSSLLGLYKSCKSCSSPCSSFGHQKNDRRLTDSDFSLQRLFHPSYWWFWFLFIILLMISWEYYLWWMKPKRDSREFCKHR